MTGNGNEPDTTHANVAQFDDIDETILRTKLLRPDAH